MRGSLFCDASTGGDRDLRGAGGVRHRGRHQDELAFDRVGDGILGQLDDNGHERDRQHSFGLGAAAPPALAAAASPAAGPGQAATDDAAAFERNAAISR